MDGHREDEDMARETEKKDFSEYDSHAPGAQLLTSGEVAPNFTLNVTPDQTLSLSDLRGNP